MEKFLTQIIEWNKFELIIDKEIFNKDIVLKSAYNFLDRWYFFFKLDMSENIILLFTKREENSEKVEDIISDFSDELLSVYLRDKLEKDNKIIRERIVWAAISNSIDSNNFVKFDTKNNQETNQIDFDKDIDDILREIENDPDLKIDEEEIERILKEIEEESKKEEEKPSIKIDIDAFKKTKEQYKK